MKNPRGRLPSRAYSIPTQLQASVHRLERYGSIETDVIEGLYTLNRGTAMSLLGHGFAAGWNRRQGTNMEPDPLIAMLRYHQTSEALIHGYIREGRPLSDTIRELHA